MVSVDLDQFKSKSTEELEEIWAHRFDYREEVVQAVKNELLSRGADLQRPKATKQTASGFEALKEKKGILAIEHGFYGWWIGGAVGGVLLLLVFMISISSGQKPVHILFFLLGTILILAAWILGHDRKAKPKPRLLMTLLVSAVFGSVIALRLYLGFKQGFSGLRPYYGSTGALVADTIKLLFVVVLIYILLAIFSYGTAFIVSKVKK